MKSKFKGVRTLWWDNGCVHMIDQTKIPIEEEILQCKDHLMVGEAIKRLSVRGAPAIGVAGALGLLAGIFHRQYKGRSEIDKDIAKISEYLVATRPTAVNLKWAIDRMRAVADSHPSDGPEELKRVLEAEALKMYEEDVETNRKMGEFGASVIDQGDNVLTHCNAGALATVDYGTALGVIRAAHNSGKKVHVYVDETRPLLQGARLTSWELKHEGIPFTLITDNMSAYFMKEGKIDKVVVGADRIAANGDAANKIGTYGVAVLAAAHGIPFYVAAPLSTVDFELEDGSKIPIEERDHAEVTHVFGTRVAPEGIEVRNPAFDVTPASYIAGIITEMGIAAAPHTKESLAKFRELKKAGA